MSGKPPSKKPAEATFTGGVITYGSLSIDGLSEEDFERNLTRRLEEIEDAAAALKRERGDPVGGPVGEVSMFAARGRGENEHAGGSRARGRAKAPTSIGHE